MLNIMRGVVGFPHDDEALDILQSVYGTSIPTLYDCDNIETEAVLSHIWNNFVINGLPIIFEHPTLFEGRTLRIFPEDECWFTLI